MSEQPTDQPTERSTDRLTDSPALESTDVAAVRLGISRNAVLQRIKRGTLPGQKVDGVWWVIVDDRFSDHATDRPTDRTTEQPTDRLYDRPTNQGITSSTAARSQLEAIRDEWLAPLVAQIAEQAETIGRVTAERDQARQMAEIAVDKRNQIQAERDELRRRAERANSQQDAAILEREQVVAERDALRDRLSTLEAQSVESPQPQPDAPETDVDAATDAAWWQFWKR